MKLHQITLALNEIISKDTSIEKEIATGAIESENPIEFLNSHHNDMGLMYHMDETFFDSHYLQIEEIRKGHFNKTKENIQIEHHDLKIYLSWFAYQMTLKKLLKEFGLLR